MPTTDKKKRIRTKDYSRDEINILVSSFVEFNEILNSKHDNDVTQAKKKEAMTAINAVGGNDRSGDKNGKI